MSDEKKNPAAVALGKLGGEAGTGKAKRRSPEHYARISRLGGSAPKKNGKQMTDLQKKRALAGKIAGSFAQKRKARRAAR